MSVLVDTTVWSALLRRQNPNSLEARELQRLILLQQAKIIGPVRQELLSGVRSTKQFAWLRTYLQSFEDLRMREKHFERAAEFSNTCAARGIQGSPTDFLMCAVSEIESMEIFTVDADFTYFARHLPIRLHA